MTKHNKALRHTKPVTPEPAKRKPIVRAATNPAPTVQHKPPGAREELEPEPKREPDPPHPNPHDNPPEHAKEPAKPAAKPDLMKALADVDAKIIKHGGAGLASLLDMLATQFLGIPRG